MAAAILGKDFAFVAFMVFAGSNVYGESQQSLGRPDAKDAPRTVSPMSRIGRRVDKNARLTSGT